VLAHKVENLLQLVEIHQGEAEKGAS
jgi:hypothetical protein